MILYNDSLTVKRAFFTYFSFTTYFYIFPLIALTELLYSENGEYLFKKVSKIWYLLLIFGFLQVLLHQFGISYSYESIFEPGDQNVTNFLGFQILRPNSFFGEPRKMAAIIIPIFFIKKLFVDGDNKFFLMDYLLIIALGLLTGSATFFVFCFLFGFYYFLFFNSHKRGYFFKVQKIIIILSLVFIVPFLSNYLDLIAPRLKNYIDLAKAGAFNARGDLFAQASDWLIVPYFYDIVTLKMNVLKAFFGSGLGSFNYGIDEYFIKIFDFSTFDAGIIQGSRLLIFTILLETGLVGLFVFTLIFVKLHFIINSFNFIDSKIKSVLKLILASMFIGGIIVASFSFLMGYLIILYYYFIDKQEKDKKILLSI